MSFYDIQKSSDVRRSNRYRKCQILTDLETGDRLLSSRQLVPIPSTSLDKVHKIKVNEKTRLDLLAHIYYNNALLWWVIAEANDITDPFIEIDVGTYLRIPSMDSLYVNGGVLS